MSKITDQQFLSSTEVTFDKTNHTIKLNNAGNLTNTSPASTSGVTLRAIYSYCKDQWMNDTTLNVLKFPFKMFTKTDGQFINGWQFADATSRTFVRDAGWTENSTAYVGIISLGNFDSSTDQAYYQQKRGYSQSTTNFGHTGNLNEAINASGLLSYEKNFLRIASKSYDEYDLLSQQSISALEAVLYKLPLSNSSDTNINATDNSIDTTSPYNKMKLSYLAGVGFNNLSSGTVQASGTVVRDPSTDRWYFTTLGGTSTSSGVATDTGVTWTHYVGEAKIGTHYYAFNRIIHASGGTAQQIYNWAQRQLRKSTTINANDILPSAQRSWAVTQNGNVAELLVEYVGSTLKTKPGLLINDFDTNSTNSITFRDITVGGGGVDANTALPVTYTERTYPFVAAGNLVFSSNLTSESPANTKYAMYYTYNPGGNFDTTSAIIINNNSGVPITGQITTSPIAFDFDYDNNVQGGRAAGTDASGTVVAQGLSLATWVQTNFVITRTTGQTVNVTADDERNYHASGT